MRKIEYIKNVLLSFRNKLFGKRKRRCNHVWHEYCEVIHGEIHNSFYKQICGRCARERWLIGRRPNGALHWEIMPNYEDLELP